MAASDLLRRVADWYEDDPARWNKWGGRADGSLCLHEAIVDIGGGKGSDAVQGAVRLMSLGITPVWPAWQPSLPRDNPQIHAMNVMLWNDRRPDAGEVILTLRRVADEND